MNSPKTSKYLKPFNNRINSRRNFVKQLLKAGFIACNASFLFSISNNGKSSEMHPLIDPLTDNLNKTGISQKNFEPSYLKLYRSGELKKRGEQLWNIMKSCELCPRQCKTNRLAGNEGFCHASSQLEISSFRPHFGEEDPLVGNNGSGTIFFTNCNMRCVFCINAEVSILGRGTNRNIKELAQMMLQLQKKGCHNINVVTPTHYLPHIILALDKAAENGLHIPLVYNTSAFERTDILKYLDDIVDIYLPDFKYADSSMAAKYSSGARSYPVMAKSALLEMHRQVGVANPAANGLMYRGLIIRHLIMPNEVSGTKQVIAWIANNLPKNTYLNLMSQYTPMYKAPQYTKIARRITENEYQRAIHHAKNHGLTNFHAQ